MNLDTLTPQLQQYVGEKNYTRCRDLITQLPHPDAAELLDATEPEDALIILMALEREKRSAIFRYIPPQRQAEIARRMKQTDLIQLFEHMQHDERADLFNQLSDTEQAFLLPLLDPEERDDIRRLAGYPEDTIGSIMTSVFVALHEDQTVAQALDAIRQEAKDLETVYQSYVIDAQRRLIGTLSLRELILADPATRIGDIMTRDVIHSEVMAPRIEASRKIARYDLFSLPVIDEDGKMVGIVTHDDALDVSEEASTEDQLRLGGVGRLTTSLKDAGIGALYRMRVGWLVLLVFGNIFSGMGIAHFEDLIASTVALVFFLPLLIDSGGNAGSQSSTLMVRALATGDVRMQDWGRMLGKEFLVAILLGLSMAAAVSVIGVVRAGYEIAFVVALTMVVLTVVGSIIGVLLPLALTKLKLDPASASAPLITSICDGVGVIIYFSIASSFLTDVMG